jgi:hypothetical protein
MFDFNQFKSVDVSNQRRPGGLPPKVQEFDDLKYRKANQKSGVVGQFYVSTARIKELDLATNALRHFVHPADKNVVILGVVSDKDGKMLRAREGKKKGNHFKSDALEAALSAAGIIDLTNEKDNQFLKLTKVGENVTIDGISVIAAFTITKGQKKVVAKAEKAKTEDKAAAPATTEQPAATVSAPEGTPAAVNEAAPVTPSTPAAETPQAAPADDWT